MEEEADKQLKENAALRKLYGRFIERKFSPCQGRRNSHLVEMVKFLFHAVAPQIALELAGLYYRRNAGVFCDDLAQHLREANAQLRAVESTWLASLDASEKAFIDPLPAEYVAAFRIVRDLALCDLPEFPHGVFCMSEAEFGHRLGIQPTQAGRMLRVLCAHRWLQVLRRGEQAVELSRSGISRPPKATVWKWLRPLPAPVPLDVGFTVDEKGKFHADQMELDLNPQSTDSVRPGGQ